MYPGRVIASDLAQPRFRGLRARLRRPRRDRRGDGGVPARLRARARVAACLRSSTSRSIRRRSRRRPRSAPSAPPRSPSARNREAPAHFEDATMNVDEALRRFAEGWACRAKRWRGLWTIGRRLRRASSQGCAPSPRAMTRPRRTESDLLYRSSLRTDAGGARLRTAMPPDRRGSRSGDWLGDATAETLPGILINVVRRRRGAAYDGDRVAGRRRIRPRRGLARPSAIWLGRKARSTTRRCAHVSGACGGRRARARCPPSGPAGPRRPRRWATRTSRWRPPF